MERPRNILVRIPNFLGDHVMALPFYHALRTHYPASQITLLGPPFADAYINPALNFSFRPLLTAQGQRISPAALAAALKTEGYDLSLSLVASVSSAFLFWRAGIPRRVGFAETFAIPFLSHAIRWKGRESKLHKSDLYLSLLGDLGAPTQTKAATAPGRASGKRIVLAPGASLSLREWPFFIELIQWLRGKYPQARLTVVGGPGEAVWHKRLERLSDSGVEDLIEKTDLDSLKAVFASAALVVSNDSGPAHVAATVAQTPTLVIFGPGDPHYVAPRGPRVAFVRREDLPCSPCESPVCRAAEKKACLNGLTLAEVAASIEKMAIFD